MQVAAFNARCPFEIGDKIRGQDGKIKEITDIITIHYLKTGSVEFAYELDDDGKTVKLGMGRRVQ